MLSAAQDESVSVREAAVDLLGKHISARQDLALTYFDILATAVRDLGTSVRKRAINIMWESCVQKPGLQRATEACVLILGRIADPEESIQKLVSKFFHGLWFSSGLPICSGSMQKVLTSLSEHCARAIFPIGSADLFWQPANR